MELIQGCDIMEEKEYICTLKVELKCPWRNNLICGNDNTSCCFRREQPEEVVKKDIYVRQPRWYEKYHEKYTRRYLGLRYIVDE